MTVTMESLFPQAGQLEIDVRLSTTVNVTAFSARQKVSGFVADHLSTNMHAGEPSLVVGESIVWRVPVILSLPPTGDRGEIGTLDVDIQSGQIYHSRTLLAEMERRADYLVTRSAPPAGG